MDREDLYDIPFRGLNFNLDSISTAGMRKASVFPDPVRAAPNTSFPASKGGIAFACTGVIVLKPIASNALLVGSERDSVENGCRSFPTLLVLASGVTSIMISSSIFKRARYQ